MASASACLEVRGDFPLLERCAAQPLVYLDSAATALKPKAVITAMSHYYERATANVHRGSYPLAEEATEMYEEARMRVAELCNAPYEGTVFTRGTTEAINLVRLSWGRARIGTGDRVVVTEMEHHSNLLPWRALCEDSGAALDIVPVDSQGRLDMQSLLRLLDSGRVKLVAVTHVSNVLGTINPVDSIVSACHEAGAACLIDGAQAVPHLPVDFTAISADFYVWSGHKALGSTGIGVLHADPSILEEMPPLMLGGEMVQGVWPDRVEYKPPPWRFEAGTPPIAEAIGLGAAAEYLLRLGLARVQAHDAVLTEYALARLERVGGITTFGPAIADDRTGVVSFRLDGVHPHDLADLLGRRGICVRAGHHCAQPLSDRIGGPTTRMSFGPYTTTSDIDLCIDGLIEARDHFRSLTAL